MLSKLFGKKKPESNQKFFPENRLEALLMQAAKNPSARPEFYKELLATDLFILIFPSSDKQGVSVAEAGDTLSIKGTEFNGRKLIPVFSSERRLKEYIRGQETQAKLNGQALFSMLASNGQGVMLNPASGFGKEFTSAEVSSIADGSIFRPERQVLAKETNMLISMPAEYPTRIVEQLVSYFDRRPQVNRAYFAQIHVPETGEPPHLIFAVQADGNFDVIASELNVIFRDTIDKGQIVDLIQIGTTSLDDYFYKQEPFFKR